jgi:hypothetical protein
MSAKVGWHCTGEVDELAMVSSLQRQVLCEAWREVASW